MSKYKLINISLLAVLITGAVALVMSHIQIDNQRELIRNYENDVLHANDVMSDMNDQYAERAHQYDNDVSQLQYQLDVKDEKIKQLQSELDTANQKSNTTVKATNSSTSTDDPKHWIMMKESSGNPNASNGKYCGLYQTPCDHTPLDDAQAQSAIADKYVSSRYGTWANAKVFWEANGWY